MRLFYNRIRLFKLHRIFLFKKSQENVMDDASITDQVRSMVAEHLRARMEATPSLDTQVKLSKAAGVAQATVQRILSCNQSATVDVLYKLAKAFRDAGPAHFLLSNQERQLLTMLSGLKSPELNRVIEFVRVIELSGQCQNNDTVGTHITSSMPPGSLAPAARQSGEPYAQAAGIHNAESEKPRRHRA